MDELPEPTDELQIIDYFRVTLKISQLKGNQSIEVHWCNHAPETIDPNASSSHLIGCDEIGSKCRIKSLKTPPSGSLLQKTSESTSNSVNRSFSIQRSIPSRVARQAPIVDHPNNGSNVNLGKCSTSKEIIDKYPR